MGLEGCPVAAFIPPKCPAARHETAGNGITETLTLSRLGTILLIWE